VYRILLVVTPFEARVVPLKAPPAKARRESGLRVPAGAAYCLLG
jgi:hypothetical protein